jgi:hypothetical protein
MKNNTKIRLHLSKSLFESIAKEVLAESKKMNMSGGAYTEAVKMPKQVQKMKNGSYFYLWVVKMHFLYFFK